mmetsp:Transcript_34925/g.110334  ORF Transcript_34925/g.110334 Transcript_34925/m.110334 type:complete len:164 (-) Transcript_34925:133-624(-)
MGTAMSSLGPVPFIAVPLGVGMVQGFRSAKHVKNWYMKLKKPSWNPPNWIFGPMWTAIYSAMGVASWLVFKEGGLAAQSLPLGIYAVNLALNFAWTPLFFNQHKMGLAFADIMALNASTVGCIATFHSASPLASQLMVPYLMWTSFATLLNYNLWQNNKEKSE